MEERIGTAGWSIAGKYADAFPGEGSVLERYSRVFTAVEANSSFYRAHRHATWAKWADAVPEHFRFAVKVPKAITHVARLVDADALIAPFAEEIRHLGDKLSVLLVQLPSSLALDRDVAARFFDRLRGVGAALACEPRHASWFDEDADAMLREMRVARVAADPAICPAAAVPGGWRGLAYWRLHGSPAMYRSPYTDASLARYAADMRAAMREGAEPWCIFDNTAASAATGDALSLRARLRTEAASGE